MKVSSPKDIQAGLKELELALIAFEEQWQRQTLGNAYYHLVIIGELPRNICEQVEQKYKEAGWTSAKCRTSSENGERPGLTGLILEIK